MSSHLAKFGIVTLTFLGGGAAFADAPQGMKVVPKGSYQPFFKLRAERVGEVVLPPPVTVEAFFLDIVPATNADFLKFVKAHPKWRKSQVPRLFAEPDYLKYWKDDLSFGDALQNAPVTYVSWFAAKAFCKWKNKRLPSVDEWEYANHDLGRHLEQKKAQTLAWYSKPATVLPQAVGKNLPNGFGIHDLYGLIWEWTLDFNASLATEEARAASNTDGDRFCGNGGQDVLDPADYSNYLRYGFRNSLKASYTISTLGFRCARSME